MFPAFTKRFGGLQNPSVCRGVGKNLWTQPGVEPLLSGDRMCGCIYGNCINKVITAVYSYSFNIIITYSGDSPPSALPKTAGKLHVITDISHSNQPVHTPFLYSEIRPSERKKNRKRVALNLSFIQTRWGGELTFIS